MQEIVQELERLRNQQTAIAPGSMAGLLTYKVTCSDSCETVILRFKEILSLIDEKALDKDWPSDDDWHNILPDWFTAAFEPEKTEEEKLAYLQMLDSMSYAEKLELASNKQRWSLSNWICWFESGEREWYYWSLDSTGTHEYVVRLLVEGYPVALDAFFKLLEATGADHFEEL
ncbi:hypothetical protein [Gloeobacter kilaueensis]|uniref:Uncharacterized protein n=1 Tax=Gloeobacter kilaueensis (strain ATCC BAA-2537 / CCAP 1431/1 / ULC 316 / JS1) TaxID=1183438 RepID=U5QBU5_GLOK1|nr:hypothetical protein [Gloeobacter kilaueensis]AGY56352.1 hypothetical protein GKIL_0105 [Gloeobacter kilaueensis JS1]